MKLQRAWLTVKLLTHSLSSWSLRRDLIKPSEKSSWNDEERLSRSSCLEITVPTRQRDGAARRPRGRSGAGGRLVGRRGPNLRNSAGHAVREAIMSDVSLNSRNSRYILKS